MNTYKVRLGRDNEWETIVGSSYVITPHGDLTVYSGSVAITSFGAGYWILIKEIE